MTPSPVDRLLTRVRHRLWMTTLLHQLFWFWLAALLLAACWVLLQPYLWPETTRAARGIMAGMIFAAGTAAAVLQTVRRAPSAVVAALALDQRCHLDERVTTFLALGPQEAASPAGQALRADVESRLIGVRVREQFPLNTPRLPASLLPVALLGLVLLLLFWNPSIGGSGQSAEEVVAPPGAVEDLDQKMKQLAKKPPTRQRDESAPPEDLERIQQEIEKFIRAPRDTREEIRDRIKDATALEDQIRREQQEQAQRVDAFREAMKQVERLRRKNREARKEDGPGKNAADALARGDLNRMQDELQRLSRRLDKEEEKERLRRKTRDPNASDEEKKQAEEELDRLEREDALTQKERDQLAKQLEQMEDDLKQLTRRKEEREKELRELAERGEIDRDQLEREQEQLARDEEQLEQERQEIEELAKELGECKQCMREGKSGEAGEKLARAARKARQLGKQGEERELARKLAQVQQVKKALCRAVGAQAGIGAGRRPEAKDDATAHKDAVVPGEWDKGKMQVIGQGPSGGFKGPRKPADIPDEIRQATQEAPAALERQRLPASARKMARDYFEKVRGPEKKP